MSIQEVLKDIFGEGTQESEVIKECYELINSEVPVTSAQAKIHMITLDRVRTNLSTMYFMISREISKAKELYQQTYDTQYTRLVKLGRPSHAAIEAEIRANDQTYSSMYFKIESLEQVKELINSYIRCIDSNKKTVTEILMDSRRID